MEKFGIWKLVDMSEEQEIQLLKIIHNEVNDYGCQYAVCQDLELQYLFTPL
jgi:hypothetical protein